MQELKLFLSAEDREQIGEALEKLYLLQDRPLTDEKKALMTQEIFDLGHSLPVILGGLRELMTQDLKAIKLSTIREAIQGVLEPEVSQKVPCDDCRGMGVVLMRDENKYQFALACKCPNGRGKDLTKWNGESVQFCRKRKLSLG